MNLKSITTNHLTMVGFNWYISFLASIENRNFKRIAANLSSECTLSINNNDVLEEKEKVVAALEEFWLSFDRIDHELLNILGNDYAFSSEVINHYRGNEGHIGSFKSVSIIDRNESGLVTSLRLCGEFSKLRSPMSAAG